MDQQVFEFWKRRNGKSGIEMPETIDWPKLTFAAAPRPPRIVDSHRRRCCPCPRQPHRAFLLG